MNNTNKEEDKLQKLQDHVFSVIRSSTNDDLLTDIYHQDMCWEESFDQLVKRLKEIGFISPEFLV